MAAKETARGEAAFETAFGICRIAWSAAGVTRLRLPDGRAPESAALSAEAPGFVHDVVAMVRAHLGGAPQDFSAAPLDLAGCDAFERDVYAALRAVGPGETVTYGELARRVGRPEAARDVGVALARNPVVVVVPCHRVVAAAGPGGFSAPGGLATKERLLGLEGVALETSKGGRRGGARDAERDADQLPLF